MSKLSRTKGHSFERAVSIALRLVFPNARRHLEYQDAEANGIDIVHTGPYKFQCKRGRKYCSFTAIKEIQADEFLGDIPILVTKGDNERVLAAMPFEEFIDLLKFKYGIKHTP